MRRWGRDGLGAGAQGRGREGAEGFDVDYALALSEGPVDFPVVAPLVIKVSARRTCSGGGHASGVVRLWYNGQPIEFLGPRSRRTKEGRA